MGEGLVGKTLGQLGMGNIGAEVFRLAAPFGMRFIAHDPYQDPKVAAELGVELVGLEELFRRADFLSVSVPLSEATHHIVGERLLKLMKPTAYVINTSRGPMVDQRALHRALTDGTIAGAGLDVFEVEPCPADEPILQLDNVIVAPHALCWTDECFAGNGAADVRGGAGGDARPGTRRHRQQRRGESAALGVRKLDGAREPLRQAEPCTPPEGVPIRGASNEDTQTRHSCWAGPPWVAGRRSVCRGRPGRASAAQTAVDAAKEFSGTRDHHRLGGRPAGARPAELLRPEVEGAHRHLGQGDRGRRPPRCSPRSCRSTAPAPAPTTR